MSWVVPNTIALDLSGSANPLWQNQVLRVERQSSGLATVISIHVCFSLHKRLASF